MVAIKAQQAAGFVARPDPALRAILLFGTDAGLVSERGKLLATRLADREKPAGEIVRLEETDLESDPDRLAVELLTVPMFGGAKIVRTFASRRVNAALLKPLLEGPKLPGGLVVEAGNLKGEDALRALFEKSPHAAAVGCYADDAAAIDTLIDEVLAQAGLAITAEAREVLSARLGADRAQSRSELDKLVLYAKGRKEVTADDVEATVGDASELTIDRVIAAAAEGSVATALAECDRAVAAGESPQAIILALQRHFQRLHRTRAAVEHGRSVDDAIRQLRPPLFFKQRNAFERQLRHWTLRGLDAVLARVSEAAVAARLAGNLEGVQAERLLIDVARQWRQAGRRDRRA